MDRSKSKIPSRRDLFKQTSAMKIASLVRAQIQKSKKNTIEELRFTYDVENTSVWFQLYLYNAVPVGVVLTFL